MTETIQTETRRLRLPKSLIDRIGELARSESRTWVNMAKVLLERGAEEREGEHSMSQAYDRVDRAQ